MVSLGHPSLPPTDLGRLDDEKASPGDVRQLVEVVVDFSSAHPRPMEIPCIFLDFQTIYWLVTLAAVPYCLDSNPRDGIDDRKRFVPLQPGNTLNICKAKSPLERLVEAEESCELQGVKNGSQQREIRFFLQFFFDKGQNASQVAEIANSVYGADTVTANYVQFWFRRFRSGIFAVKDALRIDRPAVENVDKIT
ncbi:histone-lysine N-methyltransferase SETMAR [Trichonephila clavipes]|nr:histone-lysine N-methyltransferase SETMAR [Trichonephila clavipes]